MEKILGYDKDKLYMVHLTNFFPKGHKILSKYDGNKIYDVDIYGNKITVFMGDKEKDVVVPSHRHTVHFALNSVVENTGDGFGEWDGKTMAVLEPFVEHKKQFLSFGGDSYTWGSVELSDNAVIVISKESLDFIPEEEKNKWNLLVCEGDISHEVKKFFIENKLPLMDYPENDAGHFNSMSYLLEYNLQSRDKAINYVKDNIFDGKSDIEISLEEFSEIISVCQEPKNYINCTIKGLSTLINVCSNSQQFSIFEDKMRRNYKPNGVIQTIIASGFYISEDGKIKLKSDEEIYNRYNKIEEINQSSKEEQKKDSEFADDLLNDASQLYYKYIEILQNKPNRELLDFEKYIIQQTVQAIQKKEYKNLSENEKKIIDTYILNSKTSDLSKKEIEIAKQMRSKGIKIDDNNYIEITYVPIGEIKVSIGGNYLEDFENWKRKFQNIKRSSM